MPPKTPPSAGAATATLVPLPTPRLRLSSLKAVRLELARLYASAKAGDINPTDAAKLGFLLDRIRQTLLDGELEARLLALEQLAEEGKP